MELFKVFGSILIKDDEAKRSLSNVDKQAGQTADNISKTGVATGVAFGTVIANGVMAAGKAIMGFGPSVVQASADAQAMGAQFEQVFGDLQTDAQTAIDGLGKDFGMAPNRIKPALTQMTSMFKGLGMDTEDAMGTAGNAVTLVADAAAFYDKSFEDANSALNSFIKGNYEGGEAIGLFGNETQLAAWASENLGLTWKDLDEKGKQVARLKFAEAMQESAGATGQASRESESLSNQMGNLRQVWEDLKAKFGAPILEPVVKGFKGLADWLMKADVDGFTSRIQTFSDFMMNRVVPTIVGFKDEAIAIFEAVKQRISEFGDAATPIVGAAVDFFKSKFAELKAFWDENGAQILEAVKNVFNGIKAVIDFIMPAIEFLVKMVWGNIKGVFSGALNIIMGLVKTFAGLFTGDFSKMWEGIKQLFKGAIQFVWNLINLMMFSKIIGGIKAFASKGVAAFKSFWQKGVQIFKDLDNNVIGIIKGLVSKGKGQFDNFLTAVKRTFGKVKDAIMKPVETAKDKVIGFIDKIKSAFANMAVKIPMPHFNVSNFSLNPKDWIKNGIPKLSVDWYATGTNFARGGLAVVGEQGPELITLPRGSKVKTAQETKKALQPQKETKQPLIVQLVTPDSRMFAEWMVDDITDIQGFKQGRVKLFEGGTS